MCRAFGPKKRTLQQCELCSREGLIQSLKIPQGLKRVLKKVASWRKDVPQRLKPYCKQGSCGTGKPVPLSKTDFFSTL